MKYSTKRRMEALRLKMAKLATPLPSKGMDAHLDACQFNTQLFGKTFLPHLCELESPAFHGEIDQAFDRRDMEIQAFGAPRNHGKSTASILRVCRELCYNQRNRITTISNSRENAEELTEPIRISIEENPRIITGFGQIIRTGGGENNFVTVHGAHFTARGIEQGLRGPRNDLIILDDPETRKQARKAKLTDKFLDTVFEDIYNRLIPPSGGGSTFVWIGTVLSRIAGLARVLNLEKLDPPEFPEVIGKVWKALFTDINGVERSLFPARYPVAYLKKICARIGIRRFNREFQNMPEDEEATFLREWLRFFTHAEFLELCRAAGYE